MNENTREQMNVVIVGHVDHGKSTLVGRLLADTGSLPEGKLDQVKARCAANARPFEYAFLLDALKDEQSQGITIDTARSFFKSDKRDYIIIDAPGHIEFLKNMVSGAARAEAAMLLIDANEGIKENSKRHGYMMSFLGIKNIYVCVNKMDLVDYSEEVFNNIVKEYTEFLNEINLRPLGFIPISAREGDNIVGNSDKMSWYKDKPILAAFDSFQKALPDYERPLRFPVQDIYKFTAEGDDRRIVAGRIESGVLKPGDEVVFMPSRKSSTVKEIEGFNIDKQDETFAGQSTGVTLDTQIYIKRGEIMVKASEKQPHISTKFKANIFWMGKSPLVKNKNYKLKLASQQVPVVVSEIISVLDASELSSIGNKPQVDRHDVAECVFETLKPVAFDEITQSPELGRFVIVDNYEISGGGIILAPVIDSDSSLNQQIKERDQNWVRSGITPSKRVEKHTHKSALVVIAGEPIKSQSVAKSLEEKMFGEDNNVYFLGISGQDLSANMATNDKILNKVQSVKQLGEMAHILTDAGLILIASVSELDSYDLEMLIALNRPSQTVVISIGENDLPENLVNLQVADKNTEDSIVDSVKEILEPLLVPDPEYFL